MKLSNPSLPLATLLTTTLSTTTLSPLSPHPQTISPNPLTLSNNPIAPWHITNFTQHCHNPTPCKYNFEISGGNEKTFYKEPSFKSLCIISPSNPNGGPCDPSSVAVTKVEHGEKEVVIFLGHVYVSGEATYNVMGNVTVVLGEKVPRSFEVVPTSVTAIA